MAIDIYLKLDKPEVKGESRDKDMKDWIELLSWSWGHMVQYNPDRGTVGGRINVEPITFVKDVDKSTPILIQKMAQNEAFDEAQIVVRKTQPGGHFNYCVINLKNVRIINLQSNVSAGSETISETGQLGFSWFEIIYQPEAPTGGPEGGEIKCQYELLEHDAG